MKRGSCECDQCLRPGLKKMVQQETQSQEESHRNTKTLKNKKVCHSVMLFTEVKTEL